MLTTHQVLDEEKEIKESSGVAVYGLHELGSVGVSLGQDREEGGRVERRHG